MEATETNHVVYELVAESPWEPPGDDLGRRVAAFARRRYGAAVPAAEQAWTLLRGSVYAAPPAALEPLAFKGVVTAAPRYGDLLDPAAARGWVDAACWYEPGRLVEAWQALVGAAERHPDLPGLGHDLAIVAATALARAVDELFVGIVNGHDDGFLEAFADLDALLATRPELRLSTWEAAAGADARDARRIVTVWTTAAPHVLHDYSARLWSGLVGGYYRERWRCWLDGLDSPDDRVLAERLRAVDEAFVAEGVPSPGRNGSTVAEARRLLDRYSKVLTSTVA
jgi:alpha-N-acetylglucosaminidase